MRRLLLLVPFVIFLSACANAPVDQAAVDACNERGGEAYWESKTGKVRKCLFPSDTERLAKLELACVSAGSTVIYDSWGLYSNCQRGNPEVNVKVINNNENGGFKPYCPPGSEGKVYGC